MRLTAVSGTWRHATTVGVPLSLWLATASAQDPEAMNVRVGEGNVQRGGFGWKVKAALSAVVDAPESQDARP